MYGQDPMSPQGQGYDPNQQQYMDPNQQYADPNMSPNNGQNYQQYFNPF
jgi:hypothetical protein